MDASLRSSCLQTSLRNSRPLLGCCSASYICLYIHSICICMRAYVCVYVCMHVCMDVCMYGWMDGWMDGRWLSAQVRFFVHMEMCTCVQDCNISHVLTESMREHVYTIQHIHRSKPRLSTHTVYLLQLPDIIYCLKSHVCVYIYICSCMNFPCA